MPTHEELQRAHRYIDRAEELYRQSACACVVAGGLGVSTVAFGSDPWPAACVLGAAFLLHLGARVYLHLARGIRMR